MNHLEKNSLERGDQWEEQRETESKRMSECRYRKELKSFEHVLFDTGGCVKIPRGAFGSVVGGELASHSGVTHRSVHLLLLLFLCVHVFPDSALVLSICFSILHHQLPILHLHMSFTDIFPYREHIKKMYGPAVNYTNPVFSEMRWDDGKTTG